jgi:hypothetical protein
MEALLAMGLVSAGSNLVEKVVDACKTTASSVSNASNGSFDKVLGSAIGKTGNSYSEMTADQLSASRSQLEKNLLSSPEVKAFIGNDKSFTVKSQGGNFVLERSDGTIWRIPSDSKVNETAKDYCDCRSAQATLDGSNRTGASGWSVSAVQ